jgi:pilus assembly protein Flp/PilA
MLKRFWRDQTAATAIEYSLVASLVALAIVVGAKAVGENLSNPFNNVKANLQ